jgi:hypothetical protein
VDARRLLLDRARRLVVRRQLAVARVLGVHDRQRGARWASRARPSSLDAGAPHRRPLGLEVGSLPLANSTISFEMRMLHQSWPHIAQKSVSTVRSSSCRARAVAPSKASSNCFGQLSAARARDRSSSHWRAPSMPRAMSPAWAAIL